HEAAGDGGRAGAAVGLDDVAVDLDLALAEAVEPGHRPQRTTDQALDLVGTAALSAAGGLALGAGAGRAREHAVFGRHPAAPAVAQERRPASLDPGRTEPGGVAEAGHAGALGVLVEAGLEDDRSQGVGGTAGGSHAGLGGVEGARYPAADRRS